MEVKTTTFKVGDTVELNSGGPYMTINAFRSSPVSDFYDESENAAYANCIWFNNGAKQQADFAINSIKKVEIKETKSPFANRI